MGSIAVSRGVAPSIRGRSGGDPTQPTPPAVQTDVADGISWTQATLHMTVQNYDVDCYAWFEWGTTTGYGKTTLQVFVPASTSLQQISAIITPLAPLATYHFRGVATNEFGTGYGADETLRAKNFGGTVPSVAGTPPVVVAVGIADLTPNTVSLLGTAAAGAPGSPIGQSTKARIGLRRKGTGAAFAYYNQQTLTTTSLVPQTIPDADGVQATSLLEDTDYEFVVEGENIKSDHEWVQSAPFSFHTPAAPPPPGNPPLSDTLTAVAVGGSVITGTVRANHNNASASTGYTDLYVRYATAAQPTQWTQIGPLNAANTINGTSDVDLPYQISGLAASTPYIVWAYAVNNYGAADDSGSALSATTGTGQLGTIQNNTTQSWVGYDQATLRCIYTTPASGTYQIRFGYRVTGSGASFTWTTAENVPLSTTPKDWDAVVGGLAFGTQYDVFGELIDTIGGVSVFFDVAGTIQTAADVSHIHSGEPTMPGLGPGTRCGPTGTPGSPPTIQNIPTYRDPRRPSSGLITRDLKRIFKSNISAHPTLGPTNKTRFSSATDVDFILTDGADIVVYGVGHGVVATYPGSGVFAGQVPQAYDIEIWNPRICAALGTATPPHVVRSGSVINNTTHNAGANALSFAILQYARNSDLIGAIGVLGKVHFCDNTTQKRNAYWKVNGTASYYSINGLAIHGLVDRNSARAFEISNNEGIWYAGERGCIISQHTAHIKVTTAGGNATAAFRHATTNTGSNDPSIGYQLRSFGGLIGLYYVNALCGSGGRSVIRMQSSSYRYDFDEWDGDNTLEHQRYLDNPSPAVSGIENGLPAPSFFTNLRNRAGTISPTGDQRPSEQIAARRVDNVNGSLYDCPSGCDSVGCANNISIGPDGEGTLYYYRCTWMTFGTPGNKPIASAAFYGHKGLVHVEDCEGNAGIAFVGNAACQHQMRPHAGADGEVYASGAAHIESYECTGLLHGQGVLTFDSTIKVTVNVANLIVPAALPSGIYPVEIASDATQDLYIAPGTTQPFSIRPCGFVQLVGITTWTPPTTGNKVRFARNGGTTQYIPPLVDHPYTAAELAVFETGVCRAYLLAPLTQPGGHVCPNA